MKEMNINFKIDEYGITKIKIDELGIKYSEINNFYGIDSDFIKNSDDNEKNIEFCKQISKLIKKFKENK